MANQNSLCVITLMGFLAAPVFAGVSLTLPENVEVIAINGQLASSQDKLNLNDGLHQLAFRYNAQYRQQANAVRYQSEVVIIRFNQAEQELTLKLPKISSNKDAKQFDTAPQIALFNANNDNISFEWDMLVKNGLQIGRNYEQEILQYNLANKVAAIPVSQQLTNMNTAVVSSTANQSDIAVNSAPALTPTPQAPASTTISSSTIATPEAKVEGPTQAEISHMLDYWYQQADEATKKRFKAKINKQ
ncbi:YccT family protein [Shewanella acanthi]|uniref:YccT family protein n=1 Tax=Shewanella acanthi TaxID=2864212 RepID=UPI001C661554|nr:DUF2057 domain-containing protein [Shewanella acanthi]QYJ80088.1 DUF2057 domain-containing protein [Shewanella acanthi]